MATDLSPSLIAVARRKAVADTIDRVRAIEASQGVNRASLQAIMAELLVLAAARELFPEADFAPPPPDEASARRYLLQEDEDNRFALYLNALNPGNRTKPHDHTTWAVVVAVRGQEINRLYDRLDDGAAPGKASLALRETIVVEPGRGIALLPEDIHAIETTGTAPTCHLHMYGLALERLNRRLGFDPDAGTVQPYNQNFMAPTVDH